MKINNRQSQLKSYKLAKCTPNAKSLIEALQKNKSVFDINDFSASLNEFLLDPDKFDYLMTMAFNSEAAIPGHIISAIQDKYHELHSDVTENIELEDNNVFSEDAQIVDDTENVLDDELMKELQGIRKTGVMTSAAGRDFIKKFYLGINNSGYTDWLQSFLSNKFFNLLYRNTEPFTGFTSLTGLSLEEIQSNLKESLQIVEDPNHANEKWIEASDENLKSKQVAYWLANDADFLKSAIAWVLEFVDVSTELNADGEEIVILKENTDHTARVDAGLEIITQDASKQLTKKAQFFLFNTPKLTRDANNNLVVTENLLQEVDRHHIATKLKGLANQNREEFVSLLETYAKTDDVFASIYYQIFSPRDGSFADGVKRKSLFSIANNTPENITNSDNYNAFLSWYASTMPAIFLSISNYPSFEAALKLNDKTTFSHNLSNAVASPVINGIPKLKNKIANVLNNSNRFSYNAIESTLEIDLSNLIAGTFNLSVNLSNLSGEYGYDVIFTGQKITRKIRQKLINTFNLPKEYHTSKFWAAVTKNAPINVKTNNKKILSFEYFLGNILTNLYLYNANIKKESTSLHNIAKTVKSQLLNKSETNKVDFYNNKAYALFNLHHNAHVELTSGLHKNLNPNGDQNPATNLATALDSVNHTIKKEVKRAKISGSKAVQNNLFAKETLKITTIGKLTGMRYKTNSAKNNDLNNSEFISMIMFDTFAKSVLRNPDRRRAIFMPDVPESREAVDVFEVQSNSMPFFPTDTVTLAQIKSNYIDSVRNQHKHLAEDILNKWKKLLGAEADFITTLGQLNDFINSIGGVSYEALKTYKVTLIENLDYVTTKAGKIFLNPVFFKFYNDYSDITKATKIVDKSLNNFKNNFLKEKGVTLEYFKTYYYSSLQDFNHGRKSAEELYNELVESYFYSQMLVSDNVTPFMSGYIYQHAGAVKGLESDPGFRKGLEKLANELSVEGGNQYSPDSEFINDLYFGNLSTVLYQARAKRNAMYGSGGTLYLYKNDNNPFGSELNEHILVLELEEKNVSLNVILNEKDQDVHDAGTFVSPYGRYRLNKTVGGSASPYASNGPMKNVQSTIYNGVALKHKQAEFSLHQNEFLTKVSKEQVILFKKMHSLSFTKYHPSQQPINYNGKNIDTIYELYWELGGPNNDNVHEEIFSILQKADQDYHINYINQNGDEPTLDLLENGEKQRLYQNTYIHIATPPSANKTGGSYKNTWTAVNGEEELHYREETLDGWKHILAGKNVNDTSGSINKGYDATVAMMTQAVYSVVFGENNESAHKALEEALATYSYFSQTNIENRVKEIAITYYSNEEPLRAQTLAWKKYIIDIAKVNLQNQVGGEASLKKLSNPDVERVSIDPTIAGLLRSSFRAHVEKETMRLKLPGIQGVTTPTHDILMAYEYNGVVLQRNEFFSDKFFNAPWITLNSIPISYTDFDMVLFENKKYYLHDLKQKDNFDTNLANGLYKFIDFDNITERNLNYLLYTVDGKRLEDHSEFKKLLTLQRELNQMLENPEIESETISAQKVKLSIVRENIKRNILDSNKANSIAAEVYTPPMHAAAFNIKTGDFLNDILGFASTVENKVASAKEFFFNRLQEEDVATKYGFNYLNDYTSETLEGRRKEIENRLYLIKKSRNNNIYPEVKLALEGELNVLKGLNTNNIDISEINVNRSLSKIRRSVIYKLAEQQAGNFVQSLRTFVNRTPTQGKSMSFAGDIKGFTYSTENSYYMSAIAYILAGEDNDNDKRALLTYAVDKYGTIYPYDDYVDSNNLITKESIQTARDRYFVTHGNTKNSLKRFNKLLKNGIKNYMFDTLYDNASDPTNLFEIYIPNDMSDLKALAADLVAVDKMDARSPVAMFSAKEAFGVGDSGIGLAATGLKINSALRAAFNAGLNLSILNYEKQLSQLIKLEDAENYLMSKTGLVDINQPGYVLFYKDDNDNTKARFVDNIADTQSDSAAKLTELKDELKRLGIDENAAYDDNVLTAAIIEWTQKVNIDKEEQWFALSKILSAATDNAKELILPALGIDNNSMPVYLMGITLGLNMRELADLFRRDNKLLQKKVDEWALKNKGIRTDNVNSLLEYLQDYVDTNFNFNNSDNKIIALQNSLTEELMLTKANVELLTAGKLLVTADKSVKGPAIIVEKKSTAFPSIVYIKDSTGNLSVITTLLSRLEVNVDNLNFDDSVDGNDKSKILTNIINIAGSSVDEKIIELSEKSNKVKTDLDNVYDTYVMNPVVQALHLLEVGAEARVIGQMLSYNQGMDKTQLGLITKLKSLAYAANGISKKTRNTKPFSTNTFYEFFQNLANKNSEDYEVSSAAQKAIDAQIEEYDKKYKVAFNPFAVIASEGNSHYAELVTKDYWSDNILNNSFDIYRNLEVLSSGLKSVEHFRAGKRVYNTLSLLSYFNQEDKRYKYENFVLEPSSKIIDELDFSFLEGEDLSDLKYDPATKTIAINFTTVKGRQQFFENFPAIVEAYKEARYNTFDTDVFDVLDKLYTNFVEDGSAFNRTPVLQAYDTAEDSVRNNMKQSLLDLSHQEPGLYELLFLYFQIYNKGAKGGILSLFEDLKDIDGNNIVGNIIEEYNSHIANNPPDTEVRNLNIAGAIGLMNIELLPALSTRLRVTRFEGDEDYYDLVEADEQITHNIFNKVSWKNGLTDTSRLNNNKRNNKKQINGKEYPNYFKSKETGWVYAWYPAAQNGKGAYIRIERAYNPNSLAITIPEDINNIDLVITSLGWEYGLEVNLSEEQDVKGRVLYYDDNTKDYVVVIKQSDNSVTQIRKTSEELTKLNPSMLFSRSNFGVRSKQELNITTADTSIKEFLLPDEIKNDEVVNAILNQAYYKPIDQETLLDRGYSLGDKVGEATISGMKVIATIEKISQDKYLSMPAFFSQPTNGRDHAIVWRAIYDTYLYQSISDNVINASQYLKNKDLRYSLVNGFDNTFISMDNNLLERVESSSDSVIFIRDPYNKNNILYATIELVDPNTLDKKQLQKLKQGSKAYKLTPIHNVNSFNNSFIEKNNLLYLESEEELFRDEDYKELTVTNDPQYPSIYAIDRPFKQMKVKSTFLPLDKMQMSLLKQAEFNMINVKHLLSKAYPNKTEDERADILQIIQNYIDNLSEQRKSISNELPSDVKLKEGDYIYNKTLGLWFSILNDSLIVPSAIPIISDRKVNKYYMLMSSDHYNNLNSPLHLDIMEQLSLKENYEIEYTKNPLKEVFQYVNLTSNVDANQENWELLDITNEGKNINIDDTTTKKELYIDSDDVIGEKVFVNNDIALAIKIEQQVLNDGSILYAVTRPNKYNLKSSEVSTHYYVKLPEDLENRLASDVMTSEDKLFKTFSGINFNKKIHLRLRTLNEGIDIDQANEADVNSQSFFSIGNVRRIRNIVAFQQRFSDTTRDAKIKAQSSIDNVLQVYNALKVKYYDALKQINQRGQTLKFNGPSNLLAFLEAQPNIIDKSEVDKLKNLWVLYNSNRNKTNDLLELLKNGLKSQIAAESKLKLNTITPENAEVLDINLYNSFSTGINAVKSRTTLNKELQDMIITISSNKEKSYAINFVFPESIQDLEKAKELLGATLYSLPFNLSDNVFLSKATKDIYREYPQGRKLISLSQIKPIVPASYGMRDKSYKLSIYNLMNSKFNPFDSNSETLAEVLRNLYGISEDRALVLPVEDTILTKSNKIVTATMYEDVLKEWVRNNDLLILNFLTNLNNRPFTTTKSKFDRVLAKVINELYGSTYDKYQLIQAPEISDANMVLLDHYLWNIDRNTKLNKGDTFSNEGKYYVVIDKETVQLGGKVGINGLPSDIPNEYNDFFIAAPRTLYKIKEIKFKTGVEPYTNSEILSGYSSLVEDVNILNEVNAVYRFDSISSFTKGRAKDELNKWLAVESDDRMPYVRPDKLSSLQTALITIPNLGTNHNSDVLNSQWGSIYNLVNLLAQNNSKIKLNPADTVGYEMIRSIIENHFINYIYDSSTHVYSTEATEENVLDNYDLDNEIKLLNVSGVNYFNPLAHLDGIKYVTNDNDLMSSAYYLHKDAKVVKDNTVITKDLDSVLYLLEEKASNSLDNILTKSNQVLANSVEYAQRLLKLYVMPDSESFYEELTDNNTIEDLYEFIDLYELEPSGKLEYERLLKLANIKDGVLVNTSILKALSYVRSMKEFENTLLDEFSRKGLMENVIKKNLAYKLSYPLRSLHSSLKNKKSLTLGEISILRGQLNSLDIASTPDTLNDLHTYVKVTFPTNFETIWYNILDTLNIDIIEDSTGTFTKILNPGKTIEGMPLLQPKIRKAYSIKSKDYKEYVKSDEVTLTTNLSEKEKFNDLMSNQSSLEVDVQGDIIFNYNENVEGNIININKIFTTRFDTVSNYKNEIIQPVKNTLKALGLYKLMTSINKSTGDVVLSTEVFDKALSIIENISNKSATTGLNYYLNNVLNSGDILNKTHLSIEKLFDNFAIKWGSRLEYGKVYEYINTDSGVPLKVLYLPNLETEELGQFYDEEGNIYSLTTEAGIPLLENVGTYKEKSLPTITSSNLENSGRQEGFIPVDGELTYGVFEKQLTTGAVLEVKNITTGRHYNFIEDEQNWVEIDSVSIYTSRTSIINNFKDIEVGDQVKIIPFRTHIHNTYNPNTGKFGVVVDKKENELIVKDDRGVYKTVDGGLTWQMDSEAMEMKTLPFKVKFSKTKNYSNIFSRDLPKVTQKEMISKFTRSLFKKFPNIEYHLINDQTIDLMDNIPNYYKGNPGFVLDNVVYINLDHATLDTPLHEFGHVYVENLKSTDPAYWAEIKELLLLETDLLNEIQNKYKELNFNSDDFFEEAFVTLLGRDEDTLSAVMKDSQKTINFVNILQRVKNWFMKHLSSIFNINVKDIDLKKSMKDVLATVKSDILFNTDLFKTLSSEKKLQLDNYIFDTHSFDNIVNRLKKLDFIKC